MSYRRQHRRALQQKLRGRLVTGYGNLHIANPREHKNLSTLHGNAPIVDIETVPALKTHLQDGKTYWVRFLGMANGTFRITIEPA